DAGEGLDRPAHVVDPNGAVEPDGEGVEVRHGDVERLRGLGGQVTAVLEDGAGDDDGQPDAVLVEIFADGEQAGLQNHRVEAGRGRLLGRPDAAGDEAGLVGVPAGELVGGAAGNLGGRLVDLVDAVLEGELLQREACAVEGVGLDDVGAGLEVGAVDVEDEPG